MVTKKIGNKTKTGSQKILMPIIIKISMGNVCYTTQHKTKQNKKHKT